jgi:glutathione S-transferase
MKATLFTIPGSHPGRAVRLMLEAKGIPYKRIDLIPVVSRVVLKLARFPGVTVPSLKIDGRRVTGSRAISAELDRVRREPPLFPADPAARAKVEDAERWGEEVLQDPARRILWNAVARNRDVLESFSVGARLGVPVKVAVKTAAPIIWMEKRINDAGDETARSDIAALPGFLDQIDAWIADGTLGGEHPNAADYQIATSLRLIMSLQDLRPMIMSRPAGEYALRVVPDFPGDVPPILPHDWLAALPAPTNVPQ